MSAEHRYATCPLADKTTCPYTLTGCDMPYARCRGRGPGVAQENLRRDPGWDKAGPSRGRRLPAGAGFGGRQGHYSRRPAGASATVWHCAVVPAFSSRGGKRCRLLRAASQIIVPVFPHRLQPGIADGLGDLLRRAAVVRLELFQLRRYVVGIAAGLRLDPALTLLIATGII